MHQCSTAPDRSSIKQLTSVDRAKTELRLPIMTSVRMPCSLTVVVVAVAVVMLVASVGARPQQGDLVAAASGHHHGRVQIKVYRGPDEHGHGHEHFAPHGYWIKQPADDDHHH